MAGIERHNPPISISMMIRNQRGVALLYLIILFTLIGVLVSAGVRQFGSTVSLGKTKETKAGLERDVQIITAWAVKNGRWPSFKEYSGAKPLDAWGRPIIYAYYSSLTRSSTTELCGRTTSDMKYNGQSVAFLLLSGGDDMTITSTPAASGAFNATLSGLTSTDLYRVVTLSELQAQAGCSGSTQGGLKILNSELPNACKRRSYPSGQTIFAGGGVLPYKSYSASGLPIGLSCTKATGAIFGTSTTASSTIATPAYKSYPVEVTVVDDIANIVKKSYSFKLMTSCPP